MKTSKTPFSPASAAQNGLLSCHYCQRLFQRNIACCEFCGGHLHVRKPYSLQITMALLLTSIVLYIPANVFPIMTTYQLGAEKPMTIIGGVILFIEHHSYFVAFVIFTASVFIPIAKMLALIWLFYKVRFGGLYDYSELTRMYRIIEFIGKWSMVDVFVVVVLVGLVQIGALVSITPGIAVMAFAGVVVFTMLAAHSFDPRLIWDKLELS